jgi:hypothetical protein
MLKMRIEDRFPEILKTDKNGVAGKAQQLCKEFPYFDLAHLAAFVYQPENIEVLEPALFFAQNNTWLRYLAENRSETEPEETAISNHSAIAEPTWHLKETNDTNKVTESVTGTVTDSAKLEDAHLAMDPVPINTEEETAVSRITILEKADVLLTPTNFSEKKKEEIKDPSETNPGFFLGTEMPIAQEAESNANFTIPQISGSDPDSGTENELPAFLKPETAMETHTVMEKQEPLIPLEPYYTVDYFASQGIKMNAVNLPHDKLGSQVKSFTDWLKSMKKVAGKPETEAGEPVASENLHIVALAEKSLQNEAILTETMAEVFVKQGRIAEAIQLFEKLSLQDSGKSSYFASRISELKTK